MVKKAWITVLLAGMIVSFYGIAAAAGNAANGKKLFLKHCATCHAPDGMGKEAVAKMMKTKIPPLPSKDVQSLSDEAMRKAITEGKGKMKPLKNSNPSEVTDLIAFVRTLAQK